MASNNEEVSNPSAQPGGQPVALDQKVLEEAFSKALAGFFPSTSLGKSAGTDARADFFQLYKRESEEFDKDFIKKYDEDANTTLIFAGLFSAVASAFLIDAQKNLQPDYAQISAALLQIIIYKVNNSSFSSTDFPLPTWNGPTSTMVNVQCILYASLAASLMAAFGAMLGKQWINRYSRVSNRGSLMDRSRDRQRKFDGMTRWHFDWVMESLPLILQAALLLLGLALSLYLSTIFTRVGAVVIFFTSLGVVFYVTIIICGTVWYDCPFQTPASTFIHSLVEYDNKHSKFISSIYKGLLFVFEKCSSMVTQAGSQFRRVVRADVEVAIPEVEPEEHTETQNDLILLFTEEKDTNWSGHIADAQCICWMWETSTDADVAIATARFIPEVEWHSGIVAMPSFDKLWNDFVSCHDPARLSDRMITETRDKANVTLKALVHLYAQRLRVDDISVVEGNDLDPYLSHPILKPDDQIDSTLKFLCSILEKDFYSLDYCVPGVSIQHLAWLLHIILYRLMKDESLRDDIDIHFFIRKVLERGHSRAILTDCFLVVGLTVGMPVHINDLMVIDKSARFDDVVCMLFQQIAWRIEHPVLRFDRTIDTLETLTCCQNPPECVSVACYDLCHRILGSTTEERMRWKASQLVMQIGFRHSPSFLLEENGVVGWPATGLNFLEHQFVLEHQKESDYATTADLFSALSNVCPERGMNLTKSFTSGMITSLQVGKRPRLESQIIRFIGQFYREIIDSGAEAMSEEEKRIFLSAISSEVDTERGKRDCREMLIYAIGSHVWRRSLGLEHLKVLESLVSSIGSGNNIFLVYADTDLIPAWVDENLLNGAILKTWLQIIWLDLHILFPEVEMTQQAQSAVKELFIRRPQLIDEFRAAINLHAQNEDYYRDYQDERKQRARDKLEEICKDVTSTLHAPLSMSLI